MRIMVTGGAGFIGSNFAHYMLQKYPDYHVLVLDKLTYAGNRDNLRDIAGDPRFRFVEGDICNAELVDQLAGEVDAIVNFAAETHVDRSLSEPGSFIQTDVFGTYVLLEAAHKHKLQRMIQISTDEVYGHVPSGSSRETDLLLPRSPYSASKAGGEMQCHAFFVSFGVPVIVTRASNNVGPYQYPEKLVPLFTTNAIDNQPLPVYGDGMQIRDWLYVADHCSAIDTVLHHGTPGETYNIGAGNERPNLDVIRLILQTLGKPESLIYHISDRPGHDRRYSVDSTKTRALGWKPQYDFENAIRSTVEWYAANEWWWRPIKSGEFRQYYEKLYAGRLAAAGAH